MLNYDKRFLLRTDASNVGIGAVLMQENENNSWIPIQWAFKKLIPAETRYGISEKEMLAVYWGIKKFEYELKGRKFILETDHKALEEIRRKPEFNNNKSKKYFFESNNYFFKSGITYVDGTTPYTTRSSTNISKNKLVANYLTVPLMLNVNTNPAKGKKAFHFSAGISGGYLYSSRQKQITDAGKNKVKTDFNLERFKASYIGELGLGPVKLYASIAMRPMHQYGLDQRPYTVGVRFSN